MKYKSADSDGLDVYEEWQNTACFQTTVDSVVCTVEGPANGNKEYVGKANLRPYENLSSIWIMWNKQSSVREHGNLLQEIGSRGGGRDWCWHSKLY